jgi:hypothetical protein
MFCILENWGNNFTFKNLSKFAAVSGWHITYIRISGQTTVNLKMLHFKHNTSKQNESHSFRIGAATTAHMMGIPDNINKAMGCWHSDSFLRYIRVPLLPSIGI